MGLGAIAGLMAGLLGIGGGLIIVPALVFLLPIFQDLPPELVMVVAVATSLCSIIFTCASSAWAHQKLHHISWDYTPTLLIGAAIGAAAIIGFVIACFATTGYVMAGWEQTANHAGYIGYVYWPGVAGIVATSLVAAQFGARLTNWIPVEKIKKIFGVFLLIVSVRMLFS